MQKFIDSNEERFKRMEYKDQYDNTVNESPLNYFKLLHKECIDDPTNKLDFIIIELKKNGMNNATIVYTD